MEPSTGSEELYFNLALTFVPGIGAKTGKALLDKFGNAQAIFKAPLKDLKNVDGVGEVRAKGFRDSAVLKRAEQELNFVTEHNLKSYSLAGNYPKRLANCLDAPLMLYYKGNADLDSARIVAIVGTRKNTDYGHRLCEELVEGLSALNDILIVSGLALGIDAIAHKKCVQMSVPTVGVLGHGLDRIYPFTHMALAEQMAAHGGILTEFPSGTLPDRANFPMRNRIVAGLCDVTVVIESQVSGGALITARLASGYNREVAAYPGRVFDARSGGCNELIRTNIAAMITRAEDLVALMNWNKERQAKSVQRELFVHFQPEEQRVVDLLMAKEVIHADELYHLAGLGISQLAATLLQLEMQGFVKSLPGKFYRLN